MTKDEINIVISTICSYEGYNSLTPLKGKRQVFESDNGDTIILASSRSNEQNHRNGNFHAILQDGALWRRIVNNSNGWYYFICYDNDNNVFYYKTDLKTVIRNRSKDTQTRDSNRYLCRVLINDNDTEYGCGTDFIKVLGGNKNVILFFLERVINGKTCIEEPCYVYIMTNENNDATKIGISNHPKYREKTLQSDEPNIVLKKQLLCKNRSEAKKIETYLHKKYKELNYWKRGEWFNLPDKEIIQLLNEYDWRKPN